MILYRKAQNILYVVLCGRALRLSKIEDIPTKQKLSISKDIRNPIILHEVPEKRVSSLAVLSSIKRIPVGFGDEDSNVRLRRNIKSHHFFKPASRRRFGTGKESKTLWEP